MDDTESMLARMMRRTQNANDLSIKAEARRSEADRLEKQLGLPMRDRPLVNEEEQRSEIDRLRREADELTNDANGIQRRAHGPSQEETELENWAKRMQNRDRGRSNFER